jgi:hypothetical protein
VQTGSQCTPGSGYGVQGKVVALVQDAETGDPVADTGVTFNIESQLGGTEYTSNRITTSPDGKASYSFGVEALDEGTVLGCSLYVENLKVQGDMLIVECSFMVVKCD